MIHSRQMSNAVVVLAFALEALAVPVCCRLGYQHIVTVLLWGGLGLLLSAVCLLAVHRHLRLHVFFSLCALYWLSGYLFMYNHASSGSIIVLHAKPTVVNKCMATFYKTWFVTCFGYNVNQDTIRWDT